MSGLAPSTCLIYGRQPSDAHHLRVAQRRALGRKVRVNPTYFWRFRLAASFTKVYVDVDPGGAALPIQIFSSAR
jgi:hypothetical protein